MDSSGLSPILQMQSSELNPRPPPCKGGALAGLSYEPIFVIMKGIWFLRKLMFSFIKKEKEVIQPQVPLRLPCDDLSLLAELKFDLDIV